MRRRRGTFEPVQNLHQLLFEELELGNLLLHGVQLFRHQGMQSGAHGQTRSAFQLRYQRFDMG